MTKHQEKMVKDTAWRVEVIHPKAEIEFAEILMGFPEFRTYLTKVRQKTHRVFASVKRERVRLAVGPACKGCGGTFQGIRVVVMRLWGT